MTTTNADNLVKGPSFLQLMNGNGPLTQIWLASNMAHTLPKSVSQNTDIVASVREIAKVAGCTSDNANIEPVTLRASGELLHGVVRVYSKQTSLLLNDIKDTLARISSLFRSNQVPITLQAERTAVAHLSQILLQDAVTEQDVLLVPELDFLNSQVLPEGLTTIRGNPTERHVRGAAFHDSSIEVGRNLAVPKDLAYEDQSGSLDLDFDINLQDSKSWGEGTNTSSTKPLAHNTTSIAEEDLALPPGNDVDWDLNIDESDSDKESGRSVELGRRAVEEATYEDHPDLNFDLGLEKEDLTQEVSELEDDSPVSETPESQQQLSKISGGERASILSKTKKLLTDDATEIRDEIVKATASPQHGQIPESRGSQRPQQDKKRIWTQVSEMMEFLPGVIVNNFLPYQDFKRQKLGLETSSSLQENENEGSPSLELSLGPGQDLVSSFIDEDLDDNDQNISLNFEDTAGNLANGTSALTDLHEHSLVESIHSMDSQSAMHGIRLVAGGFASEEAVMMAQFCRDQFDKNSNTTIDLETLTKNKIYKETTSKSITKAQASNAFFEMLFLASEGCLNLAQEEPFSQIEIKSKPALYEKFIAA
ncbi:LAMI_0C07668g1_1 [Lachancea mirantina]|uniref:LAMI_0C07668g1_1 n=1 Tax=Lachancea mirantina TaxID=1230905 RepID=A0A1G4J4E7_9SACH|nr:LAMI_0C07668g1_1 [Lachancea mirantina]